MASDNNIQLDTKLKVIKVIHNVHAVLTKIDNTIEVATIQALDTANNEQKETLTNFNIRKSRQERAQLTSVHIKPIKVVLIELSSVHSTHTHFCQTNYCRGAFGTRDESLFLCSATRRR